MKMTKLQEEIDLIKASGLFDSSWYTKEYPDVQYIGLDPVEHYLRFGVHLMRSPSQEFDTRYYLESNSDVVAAGINPLVHYIKAGRKEKRASIGGLKKSDPTNGSPQIKQSPRFGGREYGRIDLQIEFDGARQLLSAVPLSFCVQLHMFHEVMAEELARDLLNIPFPFTLLVSVRLGESTAVWKEFFKSRLPKAQECIVKQVENRGRDVAPWVVAFREEILKHDLFFHAHSKKSEYNCLYQGWRRFLLHNTLGSEHVTTSIYRLFVDDNTLGLVYPPYFPNLPGQPKWGASKAKTDKLFQIIKGVAAPKTCPDFPAGSFFWCRVQALKLLFDLELKTSDFDPEEAQSDGTLGHAIERLIGLLPEAAGMTKKCVGVDVAYNLKNYWHQGRVVSSSPSGAQDPLRRPLPEALKSYRIAVYTCIAGKFDELVAPAVIDEGVHYYCFTDVENRVPGPYRLSKCRYIDPNPRRTARFVKTHPHFHLKDYDFAVWIDGNIVPMNGIAQLVQKVMESDSDLGLIAHPVRKGFVSEANECIKIGADDPEIISEQKERYLSLGIADSSLIETNILVCRPKRTVVREFFNVWWSEISRYSVRDQISINYALKKSRASSTYLFAQGYSARDHEDFISFDHKIQKRARIVSLVANTKGVRN